MKADVAGRPFQAIEVAGCDTIPRLFHHRIAEWGTRTAFREKRLGIWRATTWHYRGWVYKIAGLPEEAVRSFELAIRMSPVDPRLHLLFAGMGLAFIELRRFGEAILAGKKAQRQNPSYSASYRCLASAFAHLGRDAEAREAAALRCRASISCEQSHANEGTCIFEVDELRRSPPAHRQFCRSQSEVQSLAT